MNSFFNAINPQLLPNYLHHGVVVIGNYDGFHLGHLHCINRAKKMAGDTNKPLILVIFTPHPKYYFNPALPPSALLPLNEKLERAEELGFNAVIQLSFNENMANSDYKQFINQYIVELLQASQVIVGEDFRFGRGRVGTPADINDICPTMVIQMQSHNGVEIHSQHIRKLLQEGDIKQATDLLGYSPIWRGVVIEGDKLARTLNMPTANINLGEIIRPKYGVYAVKCEILGENIIYNGVANIGITPSFEKRIEKCETHFIEFNRDIYGREIRVHLLEYLRGELQFTNMDDLINQMQADKLQALGSIKKYEKA